MRNYKISVIMPVYNLINGKVEEYFKQLTKTILENPYKNIELILVNDGSSDNSLALCKSVETSDSRVKVIDQKNAGASAARNRGIETSTGDYIHICDADDELDPNIYLDAVAVAEKYEPDVIRFNLRTRYSDGHETDTIIDQPYDTVLDRRYIVDEVVPYIIGIKTNPPKKIDGHCSMITKASVIKNNNIKYNESQTKEEDHPFLVSIMAYAQSMVFLKNAYYHYIKHPGSLISRYSQRFANICANFKLYENLFRNLYDFNCQSKIRYNINILTECLDYVFIHNKNCNPKTEIEKILFSDESKQWFYKLDPANKYESILKDCVTKGNRKKGYRCALVHHILLRIGNLKRKILKK